MSSTFIVIIIIAAVILAGSLFVGWFFYSEHTVFCEAKESLTVAIVKHLYLSIYMTVAGIASTTINAVFTINYNIPELTLILFFGNSLVIFLLVLLLRHDRPMCRAEYLKEIG